MNGDVPEPDDAELQHILGQPVSEMHNAVSLPNILARRYWFTLPGLSKSLKAVDSQGAAGWR
jgi:hypothetical protein